MPGQQGARAQSVRSSLRGGECCLGAIGLLADQHGAEAAADAKRSIQARPVPISEETADLLREIIGERDAGPVFAHENGLACSAGSRDSMAWIADPRIARGRAGCLPRARAEAQRDPRWAPGHAGRCTHAEPVEALPIPDISVDSDGRRPELGQVFFLNFIEVEVITGFPDSPPPSAINSHI